MKPWGAQANEQALSDERIAGRNAHVVAAAAHAYCAAVEDPALQLEARFLHSKMLVAHRATTPSAVPASHVVVAVDELERLRAIADEAGALMNDQQCEGDGDLRVALDAYPGGAS
jgi:hypothetical protein